MSRFPRTLRLLAMSCALPALMAVPAAADPAIGLGLSFSFGGGKTNTGVGVRVFSNDRRNKAVGSLGLDYQFNDGRWRGTVGVAQLGRDSYIGLDLGIGLADGQIDFGAGAGIVRTKKAPAPPAPPAPPPTGGGGFEYD